ncbi:transposase [Mesorhizobium sp. M0292]|uniref:transposase n=1 Tax=Mesorhizobium sp. M0292 TaxID=2956929 RepID=UPI00333BAB5E
MRFVRPKPTDQLAIQAVHRIRRRLVADRVRLSSIRFVASVPSTGLSLLVTSRSSNAALPSSSGTTMTASVTWSLMRELRAEMAEFDNRIATYDRRIREIFRTSEQCQRLGKIEGIGPVPATALIAAVGDRTCFKNGRQFAACLGLVPKQRSSGGRARLFGISKRGDRYLRTLMTHGARAALGKAAASTIPEVSGSVSCGKGSIPMSRLSRSPTRNARIVWAMLSGSTFYEPAPS